MADDSLLFTVCAALSIKWKTNVNTIITGEGRDGCI